MGIASRFFCTVAFGCAFYCGAATEIFVDCTRPDDSGDGLTRETAKRTIQAAVDATENGASASSPNLITVLPGDYDEGGVKVDADNVLSRVSFKGKKFITLQAAPDAATMPRILGRRDPDTSNGLGTNAVRCVYGASAESHGIVLKNLVLCDGATHSAQTSSNHANYGAAVCYWATLVDCVVSNCSPSIGTVYNSKVFRTLFVGNYRALRNTKAFNCVFRDGTGSVSDYSGGLVNCTIIGHEGNIFSSSVPAAMINCLVFDNVSARGTLFAYGYPTNCVTDLNVDPKYAFLNGADNAKCTYPAFGGTTHADGIVPIASEAAVVGAANVALYDKWVGTSTYANLDFYGNPRKTDGKMNVGAVETTVPGPYKTIHVDPNGNDAQSGFGPDRPMRTLLEACRTAVAMGTNGWTVLAGPGIYAEGSDYTGASAVLRARCFVSNNVSLVSRDGKDATTIVGASVDKNENGDGAAIRGAYMTYRKIGDLRLPATIRGFTFADCIIPNTADKWRGGAIYANDATYCYVEDCFFTNCSSYSAAVQAASLRRCAAVDCDSLSNASVQHNCYFDLSKNSKCRQAHEFYNCTFVGTGKVVVDSALRPFYNCAFSGGCYIAGTVSNCLFSSKNALDKATNNVGSRVIADLKLNADGTPMKGSPLIDAALAKHSTLAVDANGGNRIYNGLPDIGAFEYDWRPDYAAYLLKNGRFDVTNATKTVTLDTANLPLGIKLGSGGTLAGVWTAQSASGRAGGDIAYRVTGNGSLKVYQDGALVETLTATEGDGWATLRLKSTESAMHLAFTYTAGSSDPGTAYLGAFNDAQPFLLLVR